MIPTLRSIGPGATLRIERRGRRPEPVLEAGTGSSDFPQRRPMSRALALVGAPEVDARSASVGHQPGAFTPFIAQLAAIDGLVEGERRARRRPEQVAPRAATAYRAAGRLATSLEPGFLIARDA